MSDVFISYANRDRERARQLANALSARGWSVWWDHKIKAGQTFDEVIERELEEAKNIVVLWSSASVASEWVKNEAAVAAQRRVLVPVLLDDVKIPLEFRRKQTADLRYWDGDLSDAGLLALFDALQGERPLPAAASAATPSLSRLARQFLPWMAAGATGFVLGCLLTYVVVGPSPNSGTAAKQASDRAAPPASGPSLAANKPPELFASKEQSTNPLLPMNLSTRYNGVFLDVVGFEKAGELTTLEWIVRNTSDQRMTVCNHASQAQLIDEVSGESWRALHAGGPAAGCETIAGGGRSGAWVKFKLANLENRRLSLSLPSIQKAPELPLPKVVSK